MQLKIHKNNKGWTFVELVIVLAIIAILFSAFIRIINPTRFKAKGRDNKRLADIKTLDRMVNEFMLDNGYYPDLATDNLLDYHPFIPQDPINDAQYNYSYTTDGSVYEINVRFEALTDEMLNDGGNQDDMYEIGNDLTLLP